MGSFLFREAWQLTALYGDDGHSLRKSIAAAQAGRKTPRPERQIEFLVNEGGRFVVAVPAGEEYASRALPEIRLHLPAFWDRVAAKLPAASPWPVTP